VALISIIAAVDSNMLIGKANHLPWNIPEDLHFFREITMGHPVVMGRNTWNSIGKPLDGRINIILTQDAKFNFPGCITVNSVKQVLLLYSEQEIFVIGGANVFEQFLPYSEYIYLTRIDHSFEGDTYFPTIKWEEWKLISYEQKPSVMGINLSFEKWERIPSINQTNTQ
jgi:dihydrofolate reductase